MFITREEFRANGAIWLIPMTAAAYADLQLEETIHIKQLQSANNWRLEEEYETYLHTIIDIPDILGGRYIYQSFHIRDLGVNLKSKLEGQIIGVNYGYLRLPVSKLCDLKDNDIFHIKLPIKVTEVTKKNHEEVSHWYSNLVLNLTVDQSKECTKKYNSFKDALTHLM